MLRAALVASSVAAAAAAAVYPPAPPGLTTQAAVQQQQLLASLSGGGPAQQAADPNWFGGMVNGKINGKTPPKAEKPFEATAAGDGGWNGAFSQSQAYAKGQGGAMRTGQGGAFPSGGGNVPLGKTGGGANPYGPGGGMPGGGGSYPGQGGAMQGGAMPGGAPMNAADPRSGPLPGTSRIGDYPSTGASMNALSSKQGMPDGWGGGELAGMAAKGEQSEKDYVKLMTGGTMAPPQQNHFQAGLWVATQGAQDPVPIVQRSSNPWTALILILAMVIGCPCLAILCFCVGRNYSKGDALRKAFHFKGSKELTRYKDGMALMPVGEEGSEKSFTSVK